MAAWTAHDFRTRHMEHRLNVLRGFRSRRADRTVPEHCAMKDGAIITCRVLWELMGVVLYSQQEVTPATPAVRPVFRQFTSLPADVSARAFSQTDFYALPCASDIVLVLVAANKCVAHIDEYPDHGVSEEILDRVIDTTIFEFGARVS